MMLNPGLLLFSPRMSVGHVGFCNAIWRAVCQRGGNVLLAHGPCEVPLAWGGIRKELPLGLSLTQQAAAALNPINLFRLIRFMRQYRVRRVYVLASHPIDVLVMLAFPAIGVRVCFHLHDPIPHSSQRGARAVRLFNWVVCRIPWVRMIASSERAAEQIVDLGLKSRKGKVRIVPLPVSVASALTVKPRSERSLVLMIGRVERYKGPDLFVEIAKRVRESSPDLDFLIAGQDDKGALLDLMADCERARIRVDVGRLPETRFADYVSRAIVLCMPYRDASDSGVVPIAFSYGTPVVGFAVGGLAASIRPNVNGFLCSPGNVAQFAEAIRRIALDSDLFDDLSAGAIESANDHSPVSVLGCMERAFQ